METAPSLVPETYLQRAPVHFEPGTHPLTSEQQQRVFDEYNRGDLDTYVWNTEVSERIASYAYNAPALLLTIDGCAPKPPSASNIFSSPVQEASDTWLHLPARPNKLSHTGKVYIVKGDTDLWRLSEATLPTVQEIPSSIQDQMETQYYTEATNAGITYQNTIIEESAGIAALGAVLWGASKGLSTNPTMPRRQFLRNAIGVTAGIMATGSLLRLETPYIANVKDEPTKDFLETVANVVRPRIARSLIIDGRTAMLLAKAEDVQAILPELSQAVNVVVMGNQHLDMVPTEQDKGERNKAIAAYAEELLASAQQVYADYFHILPEHIPPQVINSVLNYVSQVDIVEVTDPGGPTIQPNFPQTVDKQITPYKSFHSPQVEEAIKPLRPQQ